MARRVVVTGMGAITPVGNSVSAFWASLKAGKNGIGQISRFDTEGYKVRLAAEVKDFQAADYGDVKTMRRMDPFSQYAVAAAKEALEDSGIDLSAEDPYRIGVCVGSGIGSLQSLEAGEKRLLDKGPNRLDPLMVPKMICNMAAGNVAIRFGLKGKNFNVVTACATGTHCIGEAFRSIQHGEADAMVAGGTEAAITPLGIAGFTSLTALSTNPDPATASRPFDKNRDGFVMGEGAGILLLEELEHAKKRGARIYAELIGYGATCDAYHITSPAEDGSGAAKAMEFALQDAGRRPEDVSYINAHGTSTHHNDLFETRAIKLAFGAHAKKIAVNSTKSMIGHLLGAAGGVEAVVCVKSIENQYVHVTRGLKETEPEMDLDYCRDTGRSCEVNVALSNSMGFGGHNACLAFGKYCG